MSSRDSSRSGFISDAVSTGSGSDQRGGSPPAATLLRCLLTWLALTTLAGLALAAGHRAWPDTSVVLSRLDGTPAPPLPDQLFVAVAHLVLALGICWLWSLSSLLVLDAARGLSGRTPAPRWLRHLVLLGCGAALAATPLPAQAHADPTAAQPPPPTPQSAMTGLPLPELPLTSVAPAGTAASRGSARTADRPHQLTVRSGDTLWMIARRTLPSSATSTEITAQAHRLWQANRQVIGADPDLIRPGQHLDLSTLRGEQ